jgi:AcrR family transcriptional regulator
VARISAEQRRRELIEAAFRVMAREGVAAATTRAIAAEAGAPLASFHYCFRSKEELLRELTPALIDRMLETAAAGIEPGGDFGDILRHAIHSIWSVMEATADDQQVLYELTQYALRHPGLEDLATWQYGRYYQTACDLVEAIADAADVEWTAPVPVIARMLVSFFDGLGLGWVVDRDSEQARAALDGFIDGLALMATPRSEVARRRSHRTPAPTTARPQAIAATAR